MKVLLVVAICAVAVFSVVGSQSVQTPAHKLLPAPTFYIAFHARRTEPDLISFRGASNLPAGAQIAIGATDFNDAAWKDYSDCICAPVNEQGFLKGEIRPKKGMKFRQNLVLRADFATNLCDQPASVLRIVGKKGQSLAGVGDAPLEELGGLSDNPQLYQVSGWYYGLETIARVE